MKVSIPPDLRSAKPYTPHLDAWEVFYQEWAEEIAASVGGSPEDVKNWLMDGGVTPGDDIKRYKKEWRRLGCTYGA